MKLLSLPFFVSLHYLPPSHTFEKNHVDGGVDGNISETTLHKGAALLQRFMHQSAHKEQRRASLHRLRAELCCMRLMSVTATILTVFVWRLQLLVVLI